MQTPLSPASRRYVFRVALATGAYLALTFPVHALFADHPPEGPLKWVLAVAPAVPLLGLLASVGFYLVEEADEFARMIIARSLLWAIGLTLSVATVWDSLVTYHMVEPMRPFLLVTLFLVGFGLIQPLVRGRFK